ncbi:MAG: AAA family ATPase, partial [Myxococcales bacterium]|nr:AAA family ATPase [Myxococcales bacterium]
MVAFGMVGRRSLLQDLEDAWQGALRGKGACLLLEGHAGMGKTTVLRHFLASLSQGTLFRLQGTGYLLHKDLLYAPLLEALDGLFRTQELSQIKSWCAGLEELGGWFPSLALPSSSLSRDLALERLRLFRCFVELLSRLSEERPVLLAIEDLHWADEATLKLFHFLAHSLSHKRVMLLATLRSEALETDAEVRQCISSLKRIPTVIHQHLAPLSPSASKALIQARLGADVSLHLFGMLLEQTAGSPFFLCGLLDALQKSRSLFFDGSRWRFAASSFPLPRSVRDMVEERLAQLSKEDVELLAFFAVSAQGLRRRVLLVLMEGTSSARIDEGLERLVRHGILEETLWQGEDAYTWAHPLFQQGVYDALPLRTKRQKHAVFVAFLEKQQDISCLLLAHHYRQMGQLAYHERALTVLCEAAQLTKR